MKVSKVQASENRQTILDTASRLYRERGFAGVGVAEITREAGFTHGGFYGHFESKDALAAEACALAFVGPLSRLQASLEKNGGDAAPYLQTYLRLQHRDAAASGCPMPSLAADAAREQGAIPAAITQGIGAYLEIMASRRPDGSVTDTPTAADKARAITTLSALVGGMVLARATASSAPDLSDEILATLLPELIENWNRQR